MGWIIQRTAEDIHLAARFFAAHRRFIKSDNFFRPAGVSLLPVRAGRAADCG